MIEIHLDSFRRDVNPAHKTYVMVPRARCQVPGSRTRLESTGNGDNVRKLCLSLEAMGQTGPATVLRSGKPVFTKPIDIERFAAGKWGVTSRDD